MVISPKPDQFFEDLEDSKTRMSELISKKKGLLLALKRGFAPRVLKLLVAMFAILSTTDLRKLGTIIWEKYLERTDSSTLTSVCHMMTLLQ
jgi:hypothetical protein